MPEQSLGWFLHRIKIYMYMYMYMHMYMPIILFMYLHMYSLVRSSSQGYVDTNGSTLVWFTLLSEQVLGCDGSASPHGHVWD